MLECEEHLKIEACVCVIHCNKNIGGTDTRDQLLQMYLAERKVMNTWYMKRFRKLLNVTALNSLNHTLEKCRVQLTI
jgi:hypothetical protein